MSLTYGFYNSINRDRVYDAKQISGLYYGVIPDGIFSTMGDGFICRKIDTTHISVGVGILYQKGLYLKNDAPVVIEVPDNLYPLNYTHIVVTQNGQTEYPIGNPLDVENFKIGASATLVELTNIEVYRTQQTEYPIENPLDLNGVRVQATYIESETSAVNGKAYIVIFRDDINRLFEIKAIKEDDFDPNTQILIAIINRNNDEINIISMMGRMSEYIKINDELDINNSPIVGDICKFSLTATRSINFYTKEPYYSCSGILSYLSSEGESGGGVFQMVSVYNFFGEGCKINDYVITSNGIIFKITSKTDSGTSISIEGYRVTPTSFDSSLFADDPLLAYVNTYVNNNKGMKLVTGICQSIYVDDVTRVMNNEYSKFLDDWKTTKPDEYSDWLDNNEYYMYHQEGSTQYDRFTSEVNGLQNPYQIFPGDIEPNSESAIISVSNIPSDAFIEIKTDPYGLYIKSITVNANSIIITYNKVYTSYRVYAIVR